MTADFAPLHGWEPAVEERIRRWDEPDVTGTVLACRRRGHFADPYWLADVRWDTGHVESGVETTRLVREDGTQDPR